MRALEDIRLEIRCGEFLGILGESGCGKSTLATALLRLLPAHAKTESGEILFQGRDLLRCGEAELRAVRGREISLVPQDPALSLNPVLSVGNQVAEVLRAHLQLGGRERRDRVNELLREVGFDQPSAIYDAYPHQLSGGQRQRIVIAQAVACRPALVMADEPTSKLDPASRSEIVSLLSRMRESHGIAIMLISHDLALLAMFADRVALMYAGHVVEVGPCAEVLSIRSIRTDRPWCGSHDRRWVRERERKLTFRGSMVSPIRPTCRLVAILSHVVRNQWRCARVGVRGRSLPNPTGP